MFRFTKGTRVLTHSQKEWQCLTSHGNQNTSENPRLNYNIRNIPEKVNRSVIGHLRRFNVKTPRLRRPSKQQRVRGLAASKCCGTLPRRHGSGRDATGWPAEKPNTKEWPKGILGSNHFNLGLEGYCMIYCTKLQTKTQTLHVLRCMHFLHLHTTKGMPVSLWTYIVWHVPWSQEWILSYPVPFGRNGNEYTQSNFISGFKLTHYIYMKNPYMRAYQIREIHHHVEPNSPPKFFLMIFEL